MVSHGAPGDRPRVAEAPVGQSSEVRFALDVSVLPVSGPLGEVTICQFANENVFAQLNESVRSKDVFLIQPVLPRPGQKS